MKVDLYISLIVMLKHNWAVITERGLSGNPNFIFEEGAAIPLLQRI